LMELVGRGGVAVAATGNPPDVPAFDRMGESFKMWGPLLANAGCRGK